MAIFFVVAGGLTAIGLAGGFLTEIDWRAIFWVNIPVAAIALILTWISKPANQPIPAPLDYRGTVLIAGGHGPRGAGPAGRHLGMGRPGDPRLHRRRDRAARRVRRLRAAPGAPLIQVRIFTDRAFAVDNAVLFLLMIPFVPLFFASMYAQLSLGETLVNAGFTCSAFFGGFGGLAARRPDPRHSRRASGRGLWLRALGRRVRAPGAQAP